MDSSGRIFNGLADRPIVPVAVLAAIVMFTAGVFSERLLSREAVVYDALCRESLNNSTAGRQALISSAWWPPFCSLLRLPVVAMVPFKSYPIASVTVSALFGAAILILIEGVLRRYGLRRSRYLVLAGLLANPFFARECVSGSSVTAVVFFCLLAVDSLLKWLEMRSVRALVYFGLSSGMLFGMSMESVLWIVALLGVLIFDMCRAPFSAKQKEAVLILALLPPFYVVGLWILMNWLVMGDGLYFLRSFFSPAGGGADGWELVAAVPAAGIAAWAFMMIAFLLWLFRARKTGIALGVVGITPFFIMVLFGTAGWSLEESAFIPLTLALCAVAVAVIGGRHQENAPSGPAALAPLVPAVLAAIALCGPASMEKHRVRMNPAPDAASLLQMPRIERHVLSRSPFVKVFVCGYDGFALIGGKQRDIFVHSLDFNFNKAKDDYQGHNIYLLIHTPSGRSAMDSIFWKYKDIFTFGGEGTLYDGDWGAWRLFEIVQAEGGR